LSHNGSFFWINDDDREWNATEELDNLLYGTREERARRSSDTRDYPAYLLERQVSLWNSQITEQLAEMLDNVYTAVDNPRVTMSFREEPESHSPIWYIAGSETWIGNIDTFEEGFPIVAVYEGVSWVHFAASYRVTLDRLDRGLEAEKIPPLIEQFVLPIYELVAVEGRRTTIFFGINFMVPDPHNPGEYVRAGPQFRWSFMWTYDSETDPALTAEYIASVDFTEGF